MNEQILFDSKEKVGDLGISFLLLPFYLSKDGKDYLRFCNTQSFAGNVLIPFSVDALAISGSTSKLMVSIIYLYVFSF